VDAVPSEVADIAAQVQHARDIQHLRETARMLFEDKPDKTKAVDAVNDIAGKRWALMSPDARRLLQTHPAPPGCDWGDWLEGLLAMGSDAGPDKDTDRDDTTVARD
jgi:methylmalonyl-CoA mutase